jgi:hypothetical protein
VKHIPRKAVSNSKIIVDDLETKQMIMEISEKSGESMKAIIKRLVETEYNYTFYDYSSLYPSINKENKQ